MSDRVTLIPDDKIIAVSDALATRPDLSANYTAAQIAEINRRAAIRRARVGSTAKKIHENLDGIEDTDAPASVLRVRDVSFPLDKIASKARQATSERYRRLVENEPRIEPRGMTAVVAKVTKRLNARGLDNIERTLLALPAVYEYLLIQALDDEKIKADDEQGLFDSVLRAIRGKPRQYFLDEILGAVLDEEKIKLKDEELQALRKLLSTKNVPLRVGSVKNAVLEIVDDGQRVASLRGWVDRYVARGEIDADFFTESVRDEMAHFLFARGIRVIDKQTFDDGEYDEYFALAFYHASRVAEGNDDPVDLARNKGSVSDWDFTIRRISDLDRPIVNVQAIRAAGALYTTFVEGELMRIFDIADSLLTEWHRGALDIPDGKTAALLNRYEILMRDRPTEEERHMHYRRVFNIGEAEVLPGTVVNDAFPGLWDNMMVQVAQYIDRKERYFTEEKLLSRAKIYQALQDLQHNLSEYMTGSSPKKTTEMYRHLEEALEIIGSEDVLNHVGGRRRSILSVIERIGREALGVSIPTQNLVIIAEQGNDIFNFIADFAAENVTEDEFQRFLDACEAWINRQAALEAPAGGEEPLAESDGAEYESPDGRANGWARRATRYAPAGRNGSRYGSGTFNGYGERQVAAVGAGRLNGGFDDWES